MVRRSLLFAPGDQPELMQKATVAGADVAIFDLEDAVAPDAKSAARAAVADVVTEPGFDPDPEICVRVNADPADAAADLDAVLSPSARVDSVLQPMVEDPGDVADLAEQLEDRGAALPILALCESAAAVLRAEEIAAVDPVEALVFGAEDFAADLGVRRTAAGTEVRHARERIVLAAAAADVAAIDTVFTDVEATDRLREEAESAVDLGFDGKLCLHPDQVSVVNEAFTPDEDRVEWARRVLAAAAETDRGVFQVDGEMIDAPVVAQAERVRQRARAADVW